MKELGCILIEIHQGEVQMSAIKLVLLILSVLFMVQGEPLKQIDSTGGSAPSYLVKTGNHTTKIIAEATGIAVTPLLGISAVSAYTYYTTPTNLRNSLAWYNSPWFWGIGLAITLIFILNSWVGTIIPFLKKPMDLVEHFEGYVSGAICLIILILKFSAPVEVSSTESVWIHGLTVAVAITSFCAVWLFSHTCSVIILISPWGAIDLLFRGIRFAVVCLIFGAAALNPTLGLIVSLIVTVISLTFSFWSIRLCIYGMVNFTDLLTYSILKRKKIPVDRIRCFVLGGIKAIPNRTMGYFERISDSEIRCQFRPLPFFKRTEIRFAIEDLSLEKGILATRVVSSKQGKLMELSSSYGSIAPKIASDFFNGNVSETKSRGGVGAAVQWIREIVVIRKESRS